MKIKKFQRRSTKIDAPVFDGDYLTFPFSSEFPVDRYFGKEILSHKKDSMDLSRLKTKAPLLFNHDPDKMLGVVEDAWIGEDSRGYCKVRLSKNDFATDKTKDIRDEILVNVSFGYEIRAMQLLSEEKDTSPEYLITNFLPFEISFVSIPADISVGIGRSKDFDEEHEVLIERKKREEDDEEDDSDTAADDESRDDDDESDDESDDSVDEELSQDSKLKNKKNLTIEVNENKNSTERNFMNDIKEMQKKERERVIAITKLGEDHEEQELARKFIENDQTPADFALELVKKRGGSVKKIDSKPIKLTENELKRYSLSRAILASVNKDWDSAGFEREVSQQIQKSFGRDTPGFYMPTNVHTRAAYSTAAAATGGNLVQTSVMGEEFVDVLRNKMCVTAAGARILSGLTSNIAIPRKNGRSQIYWVSEGGSVTESEATFDQITLSPKTAGSYQLYSRQSLIQANPSIDMLISDDISAELALGADAAALTGTGASGQPRGILNQSGIQSLAIGANGGALTFDHMIQLETLVATANVDDSNLKYMTNAKQVGALKTLKASGSGVYLWSSMANGSPAEFNGPSKKALGQINGYDVFRTNQMPSNLTKGTSVGICSPVIFGDWSQLLIAQFMPGIEIVANPYGAGFQSNQIGVRGLMMMDVNLRTPQSFAVITDAL